MEAFTMADEGNGDAGAGNAGAGATQAGQMQQIPTVSLRAHLATMFPHVVAEYHLTPFTEPAHEVGGATLDNVVTNVLLRHAQRTLSEAPLLIEDFGAFVRDEGYVAGAVDFVSGPLYGENAHFDGFGKKEDLAPVLASQATLMGYLNGVPGHDEPVLQRTKKQSWRTAAAVLVNSAYAAGVGTVVGAIAASHGSHSPVASGAVIGLLVYSGTLVGSITRPTRTTSASGSETVVEEGFYTSEIADAARAYHAHLRNLSDMLDFKVTVTDTEMMNGLMRPFSEIEKSVRDEYGFLSKEDREVEVQKRRKRHIGVQASLQDALVLYMAVEHQLSALEPLVRYKGLLPPPMPAKPEVQAAGAGAAGNAGAPGAAA